MEIDLSKLNKSWRPFSTDSNWLKSYRPAKITNSKPLSPKQYGLRKTKTKKQ